MTRRAFLPLPFLAAASNPFTRHLDISGPTMGTQYRVVAANAPAGLHEADLRHLVEDSLATVNRQMSNWEAGSEISRFNRHGESGAVAVSPELTEVLQISEEVHMASEGRFDTATGPLIELWGFGASGRQAMPNPDAIAEAQARSGQAQILSRSGQHLKKHRADAHIYLAAIGKGYGADVVGRALAAEGVHDMLVEIGGDLYATGRNADGLPWQIGVETPAALSGGVLGVIGVADMGLASSGDYRNYFERDGRRYSHVIDPVTGRPITHDTASATVLAETAAHADAWATAMMTLGRERGLEVAERENVAVLFVERDRSASDLQFRTAPSTRFSEVTA